MTKELFINAVKCTTFSPPVLDQHNAVNVHTQSYNISPGVFNYHSTKVFLDYHTTCDYTQFMRLINNQTFQISASLSACSLIAFKRSSEKDTSFLWVNYKTKTLPYSNPAPGQANDRESIN